MYLLSWKKFAKVQKTSTDRHYDIHHPIRRSNWRCHSFLRPQWRTSCCTNTIYLFITSLKFILKQANTSYNNLTMSTCLSLAQINAFIFYCVAYLQKKTNVVFDLVTIYHLHAKDWDWILFAYGFQKICHFHSTVNIF